MFILKHCRSIALCGLLLALTPELSAQTLCVNSVNQLLAAMDTFRQAPDDAVVTVRIVRGSYAVGSALGGDNIFAAGQNIKLRLRSISAPSRGITMSMFVWPCLRRCQTRVE